MTVRADESQLAMLLAALQPAFRPSVADPIAFARETSVVPIESATGVRAWT